MSILEILEDHRQHDAVAKDTRFYCLCGWVSEMPRYRYGPAEHRAHVAQVLEQHEREAKAEAVSEVANAFQYKAWSELTEGSLQDRLRIAQPITEWLRARANQMRVGSE